jgi:hypothetical protein
LVVAGFLVVAVVVVLGGVVVDALLCELELPQPAIAAAAVIASRARFIYTPRVGGRAWIGPMVHSGAEVGGGTRPGPSVQSRRSRAPFQCRSRAPVNDRHGTPNWGF